VQADLETGHASACQAGERANALPTHHEVELKLEVLESAGSPELSLADRFGVAGPVRHDLVATYLDTEDFALAAAGITLRRRTGGEDAGWHLKLPAADGSRVEVQSAPGDAADAVPQHLRDAVRLHTRGRSLAPIAEISTHRSVYRLTGREDQVLVEVSDDVVSGQDLSPTGEGEQAHWREWEVELVNGSTSDLEAVGTALQRAGARPGAGPSKLGRVLADRLPQPVQAPAPTANGSAAELVSARLREQVAELKRRDPMVRCDLPDAVHKMRVATRRLRSALATFRPLLDQDITEPLRDELKWIATILGDARDAEVMRERVDELTDEQPPELLIGPVRRRLAGVLDSRYDEAHRRSVEAMQSPRYFALVDRLDALAADPPWTDVASQPADQVLLAPVRKDYKRLRRRVADANAAPDTTTRNERLHEVRKAAKRARYAAETLEPAYGSAARQFAKSTKKVQSVLGDHHDSVVILPLLRQVAMQAHLNHENAFTYGRLHGSEDARSKTLETAYTRAWHKASHKKLRRWMT
jgi:CHAD domain-containing protein